MRRLLLPALLSAWVWGAPPAAPVPLGVSKPILHHRQEDGPAISESYQYTAGELLYFSFRINGFKVLKDKVDLRWLAVATDPDGRLIVPTMDGTIREEVGENDKNWLPKVQQTIALPGQMGPGVYRIKVTVSDDLANGTAEQTAEFKVGGRPLPDVKTMSVLNLRFYRGESDRTALEPAVYRTGETLLARFELAGFVLGEKNKFEVEYGLAVLSREGKVLYSEEKAASDTGAPFYPQRLLNGALTLNLTEAVQAADYVLVVKARDITGKAEGEARAPFRVEKP